MKPNYLQSLLERLHAALCDFSYEELNAEEASRLKISFQIFKDAVESHVYGDKSTFEDDRENHRALEPRKEAQSKPDDIGLLAHIGHEIRTPLNGIIGFSDLLKEGHLNKEQLVQVNAISSASISMLEIVNELFEYSRLAMGLERVQQNEFNLFGLIRDIMFLCNTLVTSKEVTLTSYIDQGIPEILIGDTSKLTQVLLTVMGNRIKFVEKGEVHLGLTELQHNDGIHLLEFEISHNGTGWDALTNNSFIDYFEQTDEDAYHKFNDTGLGPRIVKQIIENLGGSMIVGSKLGTGSTLKFTLPFEKGTVKPGQTPISKARIDGAEIKLAAGLNVLVFEDNLLNQRLIEHRLKALQCHIHITDNGQYGMEILENHHIDVVLMDLRMPVMNGFEVTQLIRESSIQRIRQVPIIAITADYSIREHMNNNSYSINDYLLKPFSAEELLRKLATCENLGENLKASESFVKNRAPKNKAKDPLVNLDVLLEECRYDLGLLQELALLFKQNNTEFLESAKINLLKKDRHGLAFAAHKLKAGMAMIKAFGLHEIIEDILICCQRHPDWNHLEFLYVRFLKDCPKVEEAIDEVIEDLKES